MKRSKAQLNAINKSITARGRKAAETELLSRYGVIFADYAAAAGYNGSPRRLLTDLDARAGRTLESVTAFATAPRYIVIDDYIDAWAGGLPVEKPLQVSAFEVLRLSKSWNRSAEDLYTELTEA